MENCKDCTHWRYGKCTKADILDLEEKPEKDNFGIFAYADDDQGLWVELRTGPDFGCVKFKSLHQDPP
jgi:hypothetical protein